MPGRPTALEAVRRIDAIFDVERTLNGLPIEQRHAVRQERIAPLVESWMHGARGKLSRHSDVAKATNYYAEPLCRLQPVPR